MFRLLQNINQVFDGCLQLNTVDVLKSYVVSFRQIAHFCCFWV